MGRILVKIQKRINDLETKQPHLVTEWNYEKNTEIQPMLLANLIEWMRNKGISDEDIVDCMLYICQEK